MLSLDDPRWQKLNGGYRVPYDASRCLKQLEAGEDVWEELWQNLHHQGDVGDASYASVPHLVRISRNAKHRDWNIYALAAIIEVERHRDSNPPIPDWLRDDYQDAWRNLADLALREMRVTADPLVVRSALSVIALERGERKLGALLTYLEEAEIDELVEKLLDWSRLYG